MKKEEEIIRKVLDECRTHSEMLDFAFGKLNPLLPFTVETVKDLQKEDIAALDQFVFRFSKLQDAIGRKLFKSLLRLLGEEVTQRSFIDQFNRLEQLGVIEDYDRWLHLREIRNEISHEYDENKFELAEKLNILINSKDSLGAYLKDVLDYYQKMFEI